MATYPKRDTHVAPPPPHHGWLASGKTHTKREIHDGAKILRVRCGHKRRSTGQPAEYIAMPAETEAGMAWAAQIERDAQSAPCSYTQCDQYKAKQRRLAELAEQEA